MYWILLLYLAPSPSSFFVFQELTPAVEQNWLKTLAALKSNDPRIYDKETKFFDSEGMFFCAFVLF